MNDEPKDPHAGDPGAADDGQPIDAGEFVVVAKGFDQIQRQIITAALDEAGIPYSVSGDEYATAKFLPIYDGRLWVPERCATEATAVIEAALAGPELPEDAVDDTNAEGGDKNPADGEP